MGMIHRVEIGDIVSCDSSPVLLRVVEITQYIYCVFVGKSSSRTRRKSDELKLIHHFQEGDIVSFASYRYKEKNREVIMPKIGILREKLSDRWIVETEIKGESRMVSVLKTNVNMCEW